MVKTYSAKKDGNTYLSPHFQVIEFACKDGSDAILINPELITVLEKLYDKLGAKAINITSGYRTDAHSKAVGGYAGDQHTKGNAADIKAKKADGSYFSSKEITLALEDLGHMGGIGLINKNGAVHIDVRGKKSWFDETNNEKVVSSWYTYWGVKKPAEATALGIYYPKETLNIRSGAGVSFGIVEKNGAKAGTGYPVYEIKKAGSQNWGRIDPSAARWICLAYCTQTKPSVTQTPTTAHKGTAYTLTCDWLNVRKSPSTLSKIVGKYSKGEIFYVTKQQGDWCQLESGNWMCAGKYLKKV